MASSPLDRLRAVTGGGAIAPVHVAMGTVIDEVEPGRVAARIPHLPPPRLRGPGAAPVLGDLVLSAAVSSCLPAGWGISTVTLHVATAGPLPPPGSALLASAELSVLAADVAVSRAEVRSADGRLVALLTTRCAVLPVAAPPPLLSGPPDPDPFAPVGGDLRAAPSLANAGGQVQGGVLAAVLADRLEGDREPCDLDVTFLRPIPADGAAFTVSREVVHPGRRLVVARAELRDAAGRLAAVAASARFPVRGGP